jgi:hypothetical protein
MLNKKDDVSGFTYKNVFVLFNKDARHAQDICKKLNIPLTNQTLKDFVPELGVRLPTSELNADVHAVVARLPYPAIAEQGEIPDK